MSSRARTVSTAVVLGLTAVVAALGVGAALWAAATDGHDLLPSAASGAVVLAFTVVGAVVVAARPANRVGWTMLAGGVAWSLGNAAAALAHHGLVAAPGDVPAAGALALLGSSTRSVGWYLVTLGVPLLFPHGRLLEGGWRWLQRLLPVVLLGAVVQPLTDAHADLTDLTAWQNPLHLGLAGPVLNAMSFLASVPLGLAVTVGAVAHLSVVFRRGDALLRQQIGLFSAAAALPVIAVPVALLGGVGGWVFSAAALPLPFVLGFAVLMRGLYDLRTAANRTLVWLMLSAVVAGLYAVLIAGVGALLHTSGAAWLPWMAAAVVAVAFASLRDVLQRSVNRVTFGRWHEPYEVLASLGQRLEGALDVHRLVEELVAELAGLGLLDVRVRDARGELVAGGSDPSNGSDASNCSGILEELPLTAYGNSAGLLLFRAPAVPLRPRDRRLLVDLGGLLGSALHAHRLTTDLQRAREGLVLAREEERRRLRRDLHDGLGPALAGHLLRLDVIARQLAPDAPVRSEVRALSEDLRSTVLEVRRVVEGLRPPALDELGLSGALRHTVQRLTAGSDLAVELSVDDLPSLPAAVEVAACRIVAEAVTNVVRHASAGSCTVALESDGPLLRITVSDDGCGIRPGPAPSAGHGLQTMTERAEELRGRLRVDPTGGTTVRAELPLPPPRQVPATRRSLAEA